MNKERALQWIESLIQDGNDVLKTMRNSELGGTYVDIISAIENIGFNSRNNNYEDVEKEKRKLEENLRKEI